ncbi:Serine/threonine-protein kinase Nek1 (Never in mitosis A-related kinase 1) (NimA-related protein kinase 1) [Durusdinium trenchii]|uniref:non-specific serine/threonine protein kinase n=1 Tax=Durusdinium trenchii TaxID=1381693 RepID=A0ABP0Q7U3_9DINO
MARESPEIGDAEGSLEAMPSCKDDEKLAYRRLKLLGQGSFGKAFLARDLSNNELVVMKQVEVEKMDSKARDTAVREAVALRRVQHPNVVRFREVFVRSGWLCLVMDFADGGDLCAAIKDRAKTGAPFEECAVLECFSQVCDAVSFVHSLKMVHRDIKSRNIFLCRTGRALLGDFGLVRLLESTCDLAHTRVGTPYYLSPEIIRKEPYNYKTDVWSLGVLLYEMAALKRPFVGTLETLPKIIIKGEYEALGSHYSPQLHELVARMLVVEPSHRLDLPSALRRFRRSR